MLNMVEGGQFSPTHRFLDLVEGALLCNQHLQCLAVELIVGLQFTNGDAGCLGRGSGHRTSRHRRGSRAPQDSDRSRPPSGWGLCSRRGGGPCRSRGP